MNQPTEIATPVACQPPEFYWADYEFSLVYGWHVRQTASPLAPYLPEQILLHEPLQANPFGKVQAAAKARNSQRGCLWWVEWEPTSLPSVYYAYNQTPEGLQLFVFYQSELGFTHPFRLVVLTEGQFPKLHSPKLWPRVFDLLIALPAMTTGS